MRRPDNGNDEIRDEQNIPVTDGQLLTTSRLPSSRMGHCTTSKSTISQYIIAM